MNRLDELDSRIKITLFLSNRLETVLFILALLLIPCVLVFMAWMIAGMIPYFQQCG